MGAVSLTVLVTVFCLACPDFIEAAEPPKFADVYQVSGTLYLPYAEITEPFTAYYDAKKAKKSRVDYYTTVKTYQLTGGKGKYGMNLKITPVFMKNKLGNKCFQVNGTKEAPTTLQTVLPDLTGFKSLGSDLVLGTKCDVWQKVSMIGKKKNTYTMWTAQGKKPTPVRYLMLGYDSLLGSHYDKYRIDYTNYQEGKVAASIFKIPKNITCGDFPGPGATKHVSMNPMMEFIHNKDEHLDHSFNHFKEAHSMKYKDIFEDTAKLHAFRHNYRFVESHNRAGKSFTVRLNQFADKTPEEMAVLRGLRKSKGYNGGLPFTDDLSQVKDVPASLNWGLHGAVTPVKDQAVCGSCWSFGTTGTLEGAYFMKTGKLERLSQQQLVDCSWDFGNNACDGGEDFRAYQWIMKNGGITSEDIYGQYMGQNGQCNPKVQNIFNIKGYVNITSGSNDALKIALAKYGPISVGIDASHRSLSFYANGVYYEKDCKNGPDDLDHAVLAVGYGVLNGEPYWLVKNSWSTYWGLDGYVLMAQKNNNCGVSTAATYVIPK